ncbi:S1 family peptidase [Streptomyces sp. NPDC091376]|uniref:S1 family peptidase n=1 Tax=Streptomyces sp. NPDC091376 TaxID=3365994 RepID=UPI003821BBC8
MGGEHVPAKDYRSLIGILHPEKGQFCTGALIAPDTVLTAAHCFEDLDIPASKVRLIGGRTNLADKGGEIRNALKVETHPSYEGVASDYDAALVTLNRPMPYKTMPLALDSNSSLYNYGRNAEALGWGATKDRSSLIEADPSTSSRLKRATLVTAPMSKCGPWANDSSVTFCALPRPGKAESICSGDSGGPLIAKGRIIGIVSSGNKYCVPDTAYSTYTRVSSIASGLGLKTANRTSYSATPDDASHYSSE